jgi:hypothetical protein
MSADRKIQHSHLIGWFWLYSCDCGRFYQKLEYISKQLNVKPQNIDARWTKLISFNEKRLNEPYLSWQWPKRPKPEKPKWLVITQKRNALMRKIEIYPLFRKWAFVFVSTTTTINKNKYGGSSVLSDATC